MTAAIAAGKPPPKNATDAISAAVELVWAQLRAGNMSLEEANRLLDSARKKKAPGSAKKKKRG